MSTAVSRLYRLSPNQLLALQLLASAKGCVISSTASGDMLDLHGKALGGVFSSLSRQIIDGKHLVLPWGRSSEGQGLKWKLNEDLIQKEEVLRITKELLSYD